MFNKKICTVGTISDFVSHDPYTEIKREVKHFNKKAKEKGLRASLTTLTTGAIAIAVTNTMVTNHAYAQNPATEYVKGAAKDKIIEAFSPLVDMIQALSYPVALVMLTGGALMFMINQKERGLSMIQHASLGYILVQLMPLFMELLVGIGNTVS
ncbi:hypothetical protein [Alteribacter populi]|uniref:hypothetical protein n=1 Tax=Alteribacter populi TaxID=2011011 RepID=UPI000BBAD0CD|nr:hypothetical protein [Alteribacter populi]